MFITYLFMTACRYNDEPVVPDNILGTWTKQHPDGLQTEGFIECSFNSSGVLDIRVSDVIAGDTSIQYDYEISEENKSMTISGFITNSKGLSGYLYSPNQTK